LGTSACQASKRILVERERLVKAKLPRISFRSQRSRTPSIQALVIIFIVLFILFLWLNFGLTQQIESIGRDIQVKSGELQSLEQEADALKQVISEKESQKNMSERARLLGYQPQALFYLPMSEPLIEPESEAPATGGQPAALANSEGIQVQTANNLWLLLTGRSAGPDSVTAP
jgi:cell division protein FtsB